MTQTRRERALRLERELRLEDLRAEDAAGAALAHAGRTFARRTTAVLDDKLTFTATLLRAGEVRAAGRLFAELEDEVRVEKDALLERTRTPTRAAIRSTDPPRRRSLARTLALATVGGMLMASSALGIGLSALFEDDAPGRRAGARRARAHAGEARRDARRDAARSGARSRSLEVGGVHIALSAGEYRAYRALADGVSRGSVAPEALESFLLGLVPSALAAEVHEVVAAVSEQAPDASVEVAKPARRKKDEAAGPATEPDASRDDGSDPGAQPAPEPSGEAEETDDGDAPEDGGSGDGTSEREGDASDGPLPLGEDALP